MVLSDLQAVPVTEDPKKWVVGGWEDVSRPLLNQITNPFRLESRPGLSSNLVGAYGCCLRLKRAENSEGQSIDDTTGSRHTSLSS